MAEVAASKSSTGRYMAIIDETFEIRQGLHKIKANELEAASGAEIDRTGREYSLGREPLEADEHFRHRVWLQIMKVMTDAATAEIERRREREDASICWIYSPGGAFGRQAFWYGWYPTTG